MTPKPLLFPPPLGGEGAWPTSGCQEGNLAILTPKRISILVIDIVTGDMPGALRASKYLNDGCIIIPILQVGKLRFRKGR